MLIMLIWAFVMVCALATYAEDYEYEDMDIIEICYAMVLAPIYLIVRTLVRRHSLGGWI